MTRASVSALASVRKESGIELGTVVGRSSPGSSVVREENAAAEIVAGGVLAED